MVSSFYLSSSIYLAYSQSSQIGCLPYFHTWCGLSANLRCRSETCCTRLAGNTGHKKSQKIRHLRTIAQLCRAISSHKARKKIASSNISSTCPHNMVNFGPLAAEIVFVSLGHPCKFQRVSRLVGVTARHSSTGRQPNFAALNRGQ